MRRYFLKDGDGDWYEVSKERWVMAERMAGFHNTMGQPREPATASWSCNRRDLNMSGKIENDFELAEIMGLTDKS